MAQFDANINLRLKADQVFKDLAKVERQLKSLERKTLSRAKKNEGLASNLITGGKAAGKNVGVRLQRQQAEALKQAIRLADRRVEKELRVAAAMQRQETLLKSLNRAGFGEASKGAQERVQAALAASKAAKDNLGIQNGVNSLLEKELQLRREINRTRLAADEAKSVGASRGAQISALQGRGVEASKIAELRGLNAAYVTAAEKGETDIAKAIDRRYKRKFALIERDIKQTDEAAKQEIANQKKVAAANARNARARKQKFTDIATGFGFPLLFGGGPLQALAGGIGGAAGGLGGAIAASAIVSQAEAFAQAAAQTGQALNSTGGALDLMREKSLFSTSAIEERAAVLEEQGKVEELATLLTQELVDKIGNNGVEALQDLGEETDETTRLWAELTLQLQALISGPLQGFLNLVNNFLGGAVNKGRLAALQKDLEGTQAGRRLGAEIKRIRPETSFVDEFLLGSGQADLTDPQVADLLKRYTPLRPKGAKVPVTAADQQRFAVKPKADKVDKAAREEARLRERLAKLRLEREEIAKITEFKDRIAAAEAVQDQLTARRIQGEQSVYEIQQAGLRALIGITDQREVQEIKLLTAEKVTAKLRDNERDLLTIQRERDKLFKDTIENLELQLAIETATTREEAEQLRIRQGMKALEGKGLSQDQLGRIRSAKEALSKSQEPLNKFINDSTKALNDFQTLGVTVAQGVGDAFATAMTTGVQELVRGTKSAEEVFADFLNNIANTLMQVAQQMIATYIAIGIAKAFAGMGNSGGDPNSAAVGEVLQGGGFTTGNMADAAASTPLKLNAEGSYVSGPTATLVGEGGQGEYIIPESKMRESMARYSRGARGSSVIPEAGGSGTSGEGGGTAVAAPIDVRYTVERINNVDYVTADQFQAGMRQAANQGAKQGEQQTLKRLQMSSGTRKRLGM